MILALLNINISNAQNFIAASTLDFTASLNTNTANVVNTGNDIIYFEQGFFQASVWDGDIAMLGWDPGNGPHQAFKLEGTIYGHIEDPDIVLGVVNNKLYAFVIYLINNEVWIEVHQYFQGNWIVSASPTQISLSQPCHSPNIDVDNSGNVVAVWEEENEIRILYTDILYSYANIHTLVYGGANFIRNPDVAITNTISIGFTYVSASQVSETLLINHINSWNSTTFTNVITNTSSYPIQLGIPRIASSQITTLGSYNFEVVIDKHSTTNAIIGYNFNYLYNSSGPTLINDGLENYINAAPAVSFVGNSSLISVVWTHESSFSNQKDIIQKKLNIDGSLPNNHDFQVVNKLTSNNQVIASVSGKNSSGQRASYSFFDINSNEIRYKKSYIGNNAVRLSQIKNKALLSPNPASDYIQLNLGQDIETASITIYDANGRIVFEDVNYKLNSKIQTNSFNQGVYYISITAENYNKTSKFIVL